MTGRRWVWLQGAEQPRRHLGCGGVVSVLYSAAAKAYGCRDCDSLLFGGAR